MCPERAIMKREINKKILIAILAVVVLGLAGLGYWTYKVIHENNNSSTNTNLNSHSSNKNTNANSNTANTNSTNSNSSGKMTLKIFMINQGDNGKDGVLVGCGDSAIAVQREVPQTQAVLKAAIEQLLSVKDKDYGMSGYYNALYQSNLTLNSASIDKNGKATIKLSGSLLTSGTCDNPRVIAQIEETAKQFSTVKSVSILVNGQDIHSLLSESD